MTGFQSVTQVTYFSIRDSYVPVMIQKEDGKQLEGDLFDHILDVKGSGNCSILIKGMPDTCLIL